MHRDRVPGSQSHSGRRSDGAFTIIELLVVVSIIALLVAILLPAMGKARDQTKVTLSQANVRNLSVAHLRYSADYGGTQFTLIDANISTYGASPSEAFANYRIRTGSSHPVIYLGYARIRETGQYTNVILGSPGNSMYQPITFVAGQGTGGERFGSFRLSNVQAFNRYVDNRFYSPMFYAPKNEIVIEFLLEAFDSPDEYHYKRYQHQDIAWSSYCLSPAGMFAPGVMRNPDAGGWQDPWLISAGFRTPSHSQALYPALKTQISEHSWLQNRPAQWCNPAFSGGTYGDCEPYYFNHAWESSPVTSFYDGHVEELGVRRSMRADGRMRAQTGDSLWGLWSRDTGWGVDGYFIDIGYDQAASSHHVLTTDGIRGRDITDE